MKEKIAIIGMGCVFPDALDFTQYWQNIVEGKNSIREVEPEFWSAEEFYDPDPNVPDRTYSKVGGMAGPIEFDAKEFGVSPKVMEHTSLEQLFGLVVARQALIDAGLYGKNARPYNKEKTGVIISAPAGTNTGPLGCRNMAPNIRKILVNNGIPEAAADLIVEKYLQNLSEWSEDDNPGYIANVVAGRIANRFDFGGTSCSVDAACGSSMGAIKFAVDELQNGNCDVMLCGGANLDNTAFAYISFCKTPAISKTSKIKPFDEKADGMILGDGVGMMVLKRLSDAERDGDKIYALICGSGSSSDGRAKSIYAPSKEGQIRALNRAYENSSVDMDTVGLLEAHGTGTAAGDACEVSAIVEAFPKSDKRKTVIGSVKSQVGHMRMAAGIGGAMKVALALHHKVLPGSINMEKPNPALIDSRLSVLKKSMPWITNDEQPVRRAGVSAFGFGGTNFHVVLEEYKPEHDGAYRVGASPVGVLLTADSKDALTAKIETLASAPETFRSDAYRYENAGSGQFRLAFVVKTPAEAADKCSIALELLNKNSSDAFSQKGIAYNSKSIDGKVTVLFPGQGTQAMNMLSEAAINYPELRTAVSKADNVMLRKGADPISEILYPKALLPEEFAAAETAINNTANTQPILAAVEAGLYNIVTNRGLKADSFIGHSFGELVALWADGVMDYETLISVAKERGSLMSEADPNAAMMACMTDKDTLTAACEGIENVYIANENSYAQTVVSGSAEGISALEKKLTDMGIRAVRLKVSGAFHSPYMKDASVAFRDYLNTVKLNAPSGAVYANATGEGYTDNVADLLEKQLLNPVLFRTSAERAYADGSRIFVEVGNGKVLSNLLKDCLAGKDYTVIALCPEKGKDSAEALEFAMAQLAVLGIAVQDDPYRAPHNEDLIIKKSKTTYTVSMKAFHLPQKQKSMDDALLPDQRIIDIIKGAQEPKTVIKEIEVVKEVVKPMPVNEISAITNASAANAEVFSKFMEVQTNQMQAASNMLSGVSTEGEKQNVLNCITSFQNNSMRALEVYFGCQTGAAIPAASVTVPAPAAIPAPSPAATLAPAPVSTPVVSRPMSVSVPVAEAPNAVPASATAKKNERNISELVLAVVSDKTGYPTDMIDTDMELESDLGIDSIKRVEILSELNKKMGEIFTADDVANLATKGSIQEITEYLETLDGGVSVEETPARTPGSAASADVEKLVLDVVSDKTGYPTDMIDTDMELESDLGIDSIKRVEILSDINKKLGNIFTADDVTGLSGKGSIGEIVEYLASITGAAPTTATQQDPSGAAIEKVVLECISDKTGYPTDMIDTTMELESDLGIDSIKRVEIFSAVFTELKCTLTADEVSELAAQTDIQSIVNYLAEKI